MKWFRRTKLLHRDPAEGPATRSEALAYYPVKNFEVIEEKTENGEILLTYPLILRPWLAVLAQRIGLGSGKHLTRRLQLDEMGSLTWTFMNGKRTVQEMVYLVARHYKLNRREAEVALTSFLRELGRRGLIGFRSSRSECSENSS